MKLYIYIISNEDSNIKIGVSKHPDKRVKQLQTGNEHKLTLLFTEEFDCDRSHLLKIEDKIHKECKYLCEGLQGEWFKISPNNIERLKKFIIYNRIRYEDDINYFNRSNK